MSRTVRSVNADDEHGPISSIRIRGIDVLVAVAATIDRLLGRPSPSRRSSFGYVVGTHEGLRDADVRRSAERVLCKDLSAVMSDTPPHFKPWQLERAVVYACASALNLHNVGKPDQIERRARELLDDNGEFTVETTADGIKITPSFVEVERKRAEAEYVEQERKRAERTPVIVGSIDDVRAAFRCDGVDE